MSKVIRTLGFDPGSKNFGCFAGEVVLHDNFPLMRVIESKMLEHKVDNLTGNLSEEIQPYMDEMSAMIHAHRPHMVVIERFMTRGPKGTLIEYVGVMVGALAAMLYNYDSRIRLITPTAAGWKNRVNQIVDLKTIYTVLKRYKVPDHRVDASLLHLYGLKRYRNPYEFLGVKKHRDTYLRSMID